MYSFMFKQEKADPESKATKKMYMSVLDTENTFVRVRIIECISQLKLYLNLQEYLWRQQVSFVFTCATKMQK